MNAAEAMPGGGGLYLKAMKRGHPGVRSVLEAHVGSQHLSTRGNWYFS
jgi:hypothetical protein